MSALQGKEGKDFECYSWEEEETQFHALDHQYETEAESNEVQLLRNTQFWSSLNKLLESGYLTAEQTKSTRSNSIIILNRIGSLYNSLRNYRWAIACHFLVLDYISRFEYTRALY